MTKITLLISFLSTLTAFYCCYYGVATTVSVCPQMDVFASITMSKTSTFLLRSLFAWSYVKGSMLECKYMSSFWTLMELNPLVPGVPILGTVVLTGLVCDASNIFSVC